LSTLATRFASAFGIVREVSTLLSVALTFFGCLLLTFAVSTGLLIGFPIPAGLLSASSTCLG
jgi:hypothetical protein